HGVRIIIREPNQPVGTIVVLPGWNHAAEKVCQETSFCQQALSKGYRIILPDMQKSVYLDSIYPETSAWLANQPNFSWIQSYFIPWLSEQFWGQMNQPKILIGISTGGRGAVKISLRFPTLFDKVYSLSGDFIPELQPNDPLMRASLGSMVRFPERWKTENLTLFPITQHKIVLFHGKQDKIVPVSQSIEFHKRMKSDNIQIRIHETAGHDFRYWNECLQDILAEN
ncbi:MAG: esterase family protein, partial [Bacteroidia bacterium]|nr:esterase family protein [Bacteroidia bacterium]